MMRSVAYVANLEVDDYVFVDNDIEASAFESESYDYCDDDISEYSSCGKAEPSLSLPFGNPFESLCESAFPNEVNFSLSSLAIVGVSEVHKEAIRLMENHVHEWTPNHSHKDSLSMLSENLLESFVPNEAECVISSSLVEGLDNVHQEALFLLEKECQESLSNHSRNEDPSTQSPPLSSSGEETPSEDNTLDQSGALDDVTQRQGSRKSNKKRRRHLKLMRKAAAAAAAAAAISEFTRTGTNSAASPGKKSIAGGGRLTKRVANIAVACAAESIAHYKAEHSGKTKKPY